MLRRSRREPFITHHKSKYDGRLPVWVAIEVWDFGLLSRLFEGLQFKDKNHIAKKYGLADGDTMAKWIRSLNFIRNVSAHHSRLWNINVLEPSPCPDHWPDIKNTKPFLYFAIMAQLMGVICPNSTWLPRLVELLKACPASRNGKRPICVRHGRSCRDILRVKGLAPAWKGGVPDHSRDHDQWHNRYWPEQRPRSARSSPQRCR